VVGVTGDLIDQYLAELGAAIENFGSARAIVRSHRRHHAASEMSLAACQMVAIYLLVVAGTGVLLAMAGYLLARSRVFALDGSRPGSAAAGGPLVAMSRAAALGGCAVAGLIVLAGYRRALRSRRGRRSRGAPLGGYFPLFAAIFTLVAGPIAVILIGNLAHPSGAFAVLAQAGVLGSVLVALGYTVQMARTLIRQRRDARTTDTEVRYAR
jgi:hypothetical protein